MTTKTEFTQEEWEALQKGVTGAGFLMAVSDRSFFDSFKEAGALARHLSEARKSASSELIRELAEARGTGFGLTSSPDEIESETLGALRDAMASPTVVERPELAVDEHPHRQRHRVPARRDQPAEDAVPGRAFVEMKRLRVESGGERLDPREVDRGGAAGVSLADREVLEIAGARWWMRRHVGLRTEGRRLRTGGRADAELIPQENTSRPLP